MWMIERLSNDLVLDCSYAPDCEWLLGSPVQDDRGDLTKGFTVSFPQARAQCISSDILSLFFARFPR